MNFLEIGLAFVEGLALILSPCILPVLPLVLSASVEGGKGRPYGIITGFVVAFSLFVLGSRQIVTTLHIDLDIIKDASLVLLFLFGVILISEKLSANFSSWTQGTADLGSRLAGAGEDGFFSGISIGSLIGLIWTPCAGPILAAVLVQVIRQQTNLESVLVTVAFAVGAGMPMLSIAVVGRTIMGRLRFFTQHTEVIRKGFGLLIILSVVFLAFGAGAISSFSSSNGSVASGVLQLEGRLESSYAAPELTDVETWLNSPPLTLASLRGKVVLVDFWTYSCINCVRTLPYITAWDKKYRDKGLVIIGVHAPEFEFEKNVDNIKTAIAKYGIQYPVAVDNHLSTWVAFNNRYWPAHYLIDKNGQVVYTHFGEGEYNRTENNIRYLVGLNEKVAETPESAGVSVGQTPETYLGYARADRFRGKPSLQQDVATTYKPAIFVPEHQWTLGGSWTVGEEKITAQEQGALLKLNFKAKKVFLVMGTASGKPSAATVQLNGEPSGAQSGSDVHKGEVTINGHALYELINQTDAQNSELEIVAKDAGLEFYAFTFGE